MNSDADNTEREWEDPHPGYLLGVESGKELLAFAFISVLFGVFKGLYVLFYNLKIIQNDKSNHTVTQEKMVKCFCNVGAKPSFRIT